MKITDVRAHHIRIPYDAGPASFRQGASAISALDMVLVEVATDAGLTGWGDAFAYVCPRTTCSAVSEMIAPQARGQDVPDAAGIPAFMEQVLQQCGDDLTRENVMKQAANLNFEIGIYLPGTKIKTSPTDFAPLEQLQMMRFKGESWELFGPLMSGEKGS